VVQKLCLSTYQYELSGDWIYVMELQKKVVFQGTRSQVWNYQFTMGKGIQWSLDITEELYCWNML